ncbi:MAG: glycosyltransferase [Alphaproteobacteria bacterium]
MSEVLAEAERLDKAGEYQGIVNLLVQRSNEPSLFVTLLCHLLKTHRFAAAHHVSSALVGVGVDHFLPHFGRAVGGLLLAQPAAQTESNRELARLIDVLPPQSQEIFCAEVLRPAMYGVVGVALRTGDWCLMPGAIELIKSASPKFRVMFDWSGEAPTDIEVMRREGQAGARLIQYRSPPPNAPRVAHRAVVALRSRIFPQNPQSRELDIGPRFMDAAERYGWPARFAPTSWLNVQGDFDSVLAACCEHSADILILDDQLVQSSWTLAPRRDFITRLRAERPGIKVVALYLDSWEIDPALLREAVTDVDAVWATAPAMPHWREPAFAAKTLHAPLVHGGHAKSPNGLAPGRLSFVGGVMGYNWHRALWRTASIVNDLPIDWHLSTHQADGLPPLESYRAYMEKLGTSGCSLNLAMRPDLSCVATDRSFEAPLAGALLVQEAADDLDYFFIAGEHYLRFSTFAELRAITELIERQPDAVQAIRAAGHEFAVSRYSDEKLMSYLDAILFHTLNG